LTPYARTAIERDDESVQYASAGQNVTLYLAQIDPIHLNIGSVLCPLAIPELVPMATTFTAQILVFDISQPIITGTPVELFHHSNNVPATITKLLSVMDKGSIIKKNPRYEHSTERIAGLPLS
jgi:elongation factor 1 alpha-like protein